MDLTKYVFAVGWAWPKNHKKLIGPVNHPVRRIGNWLVRDFASNSRCCNRVLTSDKLIHYARICSIIDAFGWTLEPGYSVFKYQNYWWDLWGPWIIPTRLICQNLWLNWVYQNSVLTSWLIKNTPRNFVTSNWIFTDFSWEIETFKLESLASGQFNW